MNKVKSVLFMAGVSLALGFAFGCSGDSGGGGNGNGEQSNISSGTEANVETSSSSKGTDKSSSSNGAEDNLSSGTVTDNPSSSSEASGNFSSSGTVTDNSSSSNLGGSSSSKDSEVAGSLKKDQISGVSQKGPFVKGSTATLYELDSKFVQTGRSFRDIIADDKGSFDIKINVALVSPYVMLEADGYYRNEVTGKISTSTIKLYAIADIREKSNVNVNILTHLEYYRVQKLVEGGKNLKDAKKQAQKEILAVFGINGEFKDSEDMSIFGFTEGDAALLAISVLLQGELSEGQFVERLADFNLGFKETGTWDNKTAKDAMADWAVPTQQGGSGNYCYYEPTNEYPNNCWPMPTNDMCQSGRLVERCSNAGNTSGTTTSNLTKVRSNILGWNLPSNVPNFEKFVNNYWYVNYGLGNCDASLQNSIKSSNKKVDYICKNNAWAVATQYERDTYQLDCNGDGEIKKGNVSDVKYICKSKAWAIATIYELDTYQWVCTEGEIKTGQASGKKYICKNSAWAIATEYELDTYQWVCTEGEVKDGQASGKKYICKNGKWQTPKYIEIKCFESKSCLTFTDERDNQSYVYVVIGEQTWMAENLNYAADGSKCGNSDENNAICDTYGRLYKWTTAMAGSASSTANPSGVRGVCPSEWHLPSSAEWNALITAIGGSSMGTKLKATSGWDNSHANAGTDDFGFSAVPSGYGGSGSGSFSFSDGGYGFWWSSSEYGSSYAYYMGLKSYLDELNYSYDHKSIFLFSVRCVQD